MRILFASVAFLALLPACSSPSTPPPPPSQMALLLTPSIPPSQVFTASASTATQTPSHPNTPSPTFARTATSTSTLTPTPEPTITASPNPPSATPRPPTPHSPVPPPTNTKAPLPTANPTATKGSVVENCAQVHGLELLQQAWRLEGANGDSQASQDIDPNSLVGKDTLLVTYDLHGLVTFEGPRKDQSAIIFDQPHWFVVSLANYGVNGKDGIQVVKIPLSDFIELPDAPSGTPGGRQLDLKQPVGTLHARIWDQSHFTVDITSICAFKSA